MARLNRSTRKSGDMMLVRTEDSAWQGAEGSGSCSGGFGPKERGREMGISLILGSLMEFSKWEGKCDKSRYFEAHSRGCS